MPARSPQAEALFLDGNQHMTGGDAAAAERCFREALAIAPAFAEALANLALLRERAGDVTVAESYYREALALRPDAVQVWLNLGVLLMNLKRFADAEAAGRRALQVAPDSPAAWSNLGVLLACLQRDDEAERCHRTALKLDDGFAMARFNLSYLLLRQGRYEEGWQCLEARKWYGGLAAHFDCPRWQGEALNGKAVVIGFEAGHGDMIQFCRYATVLKSMGAARVALVCHPGLKELFTTLAGVDEVYAFDENVAAAGWDFWTPPLSLPHFCRTRLDNIPAPIPYLSADPAKIARWSPLIPGARLRVGLAWKGNARFENDADRSLPALDLLAPLGAVAGVQFISLQKGAGEDEAARRPPGMDLQAVGHLLENFADTAAVIANLDLVISVDTAVAHLAGALGKPCWVLLPAYRADWRWLTARADSPWYPGTLRLFRQTAAGGWPAVITEVAAALRKLIAA